MTYIHGTAEMRPLWHIATERSDSGTLIPTRCHRLVIADGFRYQEPADTELCARCVRTVELEKALLQRSKALRNGEE